MNPMDNNDTYHDFIRYRKPIKTLVGHLIRIEDGQMAIKYKLHLGAIALGYVYVLGMALAACVLTSGDHVLFFDAFHLVLLVFDAMTGVSSRVANDRELKAIVSSLKDGVYRYEEEAEDEVHLSLKRAGVRECRDVIRFFFFTIFFRWICNGFLQPAADFLLFGGQDTSTSPINPYLPQPIYMPFSTQSVLGFTAAYLINIVFITFTSSIVLCQDEYYVSILLQIKTELKILNHSLLNIEKRALSRFTADIEFNSIQELYESKEFQNCMYACIRANMLHYQAIMRLVNYARAYTGANFLFIMFSAAIAQALLAILILENPETYVIGNIAVSLATEVFFTLHFCWYGEVLSTESSKVFHNLYATPWMYCDRKFNVMLSIMMELTKQPIEIRASILDFKARMKIFGDIICKVYQLINVLRNTP